MQPRMQEPSPHVPAESCSVLGRCPLTKTRGRGQKAVLNQGQFSARADSGKRTSILIILCHFLLDESPSGVNEHSITCPGPKIKNTGE